MRRLAITLLACAMLISAVPAHAVAARRPSRPAVADLLCDRSFDAGDVTIWADEDFLYVDFLVTRPGWQLLDTRLSVVPAGGKPRRTLRGESSVGFADSREHPWAREYRYRIPNTWPSGTKLRVSASGTIGQRGGGLEAVPGSLPATVVELSAYDGRESYFRTTITGGGALDGTYAGWCLDQTLDHPGTATAAETYSSYDVETIPAGVMDHPENLDLVNWILNEDFVHRGYSVYSVQLAMWTLLQTDPQQSYPSVEAILADARSQGEGYIPGYGESVGVILLPRTAAGGWHQPVLVPWPVPDFPIARKTVRADARANGRGRSPSIDYVTP